MTTTRDDAHAAWSAFEKIASDSPPGVDVVRMQIVRLFLMEAAQVGRYRVTPAAPGPADVSGRMLPEGTPEPAGNGKATARVVHGFQVFAADREYFVDSTGTAWALHMAERAREVERIQAGPSLAEAALAVDRWARNQQQQAPAGHPLQRLSAVLDVAEGLRA